MRLAPEKKSSSAAAGAGVGAGVGVAQAGTPVVSEEQEELPATITTAYAVAEPEESAEVSREVERRESPHCSLTSRGGLLFLHFASEAHVQSTAHCRSPTEPCEQTY